MRLPKLEQWELVRVEWMDSRGGDNGWHKPKRKSFAIEGCVTVGQVYAMSSDRIVLVLSRDTLNDYVDSLITIPSIAITKLNILKVT